MPLNNPSLALEESAVLDPSCLHDQVEQGRLAPSDAAEVLLHQFMAEGIDNDPIDNSALERIDSRSRRMSSTAKSLLDRAFSAHQSISSLKDSAAANSLTLNQLAAKVEVDLSLLAKLERRLIRASTVPGELVHRLASALSTQVDQIAAYLRQPPTLSLAADFKSTSRPTVAEQESFETALRASSLPAKTIDEWLSHPPIGAD